MQETEEKQILRGHGCRDGESENANEDNGLAPVRKSSPLFHDNDHRRMGILKQLSDIERRLQSHPMVQNAQGSCLTGGTDEPAGATGGFKQITIKRNQIKQLHDEDGQPLIDTTVDETKEEKDKLPARE